MPSNLIMPIMAVLVLFLFMSFTKKQTKKAKEREVEKRNNIKVGTKVVTYSGIVATVEQVGEKYLKVNTGNNVIVILSEAVLKILDEEVEFFNTITNNSSVKLEIMTPNSTNSKREEYGF